MPRDGMCSGRQGAVRAKEAATIAPWPSVGELTPMAGAEVARELVQTLTNCTAGVTMADKDGEQSP